MKTFIHRSASRGAADYGWLKTSYSFSFAGWHDPERMGFGALRVLNDDWIAPRRGFDIHDHDNFEIVTIVRKGAVTHEDSMGNRTRLSSGEVQAMSAGSGLQHGEFNNEGSPLELFQLWIEPSERDTEPSYRQAAFDPAGRRNELQEVVGKGKGALPIGQDASIFLLDLSEGSTVSRRLPEGRGAYVFLIDGEAAAAGAELFSRDACGIYDTVSYTMQARNDSSFIIIEVPFPGGLS